MFMYQTQFQYQNISVYLTQSNFSTDNHFNWLLFIMFINTRQVMFPSV